MPLEPGTRLGPYEIEGVLGVGGMGEVYRAHDPRLNRAVALKLLPPDVGADPERTARFKREAQAVAALNHPYIVTIYSVEEADGAPFLTMELVEGQTLAEMIPAGGLTTDKLLRVAHGIAEALSAAHERGIVHRDLKPGNIMITVDGRVKVLDFGLAKFRAVLANSESTTQLASDLTAEGRFLGTVVYMSPEQAEGKPVDQRSDIFSLGVMLHELATGQRPFKGNTSASLISSILKDTPPLVSDVKPALPRELARVIRRCLVKDPSRRYQSVLDPRNELEEIEQEVRSGELRAPGVAENRHRHGQRLSRPALTATLVAVAIAIGLWYEPGAATVNAHRRESSGYRCRTLPGFGLRSWPLHLPWRSLPTASGLSSGGRATIRIEGIFIFAPQTNSTLGWSPGRERPGVRSFRRTAGG